MYALLAVGTSCPQTTNAGLINLHYRAKLYNQVLRIVKIVVKSDVNINKIKINKHLYTYVRKETYHDQGRNINQLQFKTIQLVEYFT